MNVSLKRWANVILQAVLGGLVVAVVFYLNPGWTEIVTKFPREGSIAGWVVSLLSVWTLISILSGWSLSIAPLLKYPPTAWALILGYAISVGIMGKSWMAFVLGFVIQAVFWFAGRVLVCGYQQIQKPRPKNSTPNPSPDSEHWFMDDRPVTNPDEDRFKMGGTEKQIVHLITEENKNVAVLGKYGSGKSTIIEWAKKQLPEEYIVCQLGAWGRRREGFSSHLLRMGTAKLKPYMDVLSFIAVPLQYHAALSSKGFWGELFAAALASSDPADVLTRLNEALEVAKRKLLFIIEDVDRNRDKTLLNEDLPALLDRIGHMRNIHFILAVDAEATDAAWLLRIASCVDIPIIESSQAQQEIEKFRKLIFDGSWIDPVPREKRDEWFSLGVPDASNLEQFYLDKALSTRLALINLLTNPRELKAVFRETWQKWGHLKGEIDPDDLLVLTAIKIAQPTLHQILLDERIGFIELAEKASGVDAEKREKQLFVEKIKQHWAKQGESWTPTLDAVLDHLFLHWNFGSSPSLKEKPQSIAIRSGVGSETDYWNRAQRGLIIETVRDQTVLELIRKAETDPIARRELAKNIYEKELWPSKLLQFGRIIWNEVSVRDFLDTYFDLLINDPDVDRHARNIPGWEKALSLALSRWPEDFDGAKWWYKHALRAVENSLGLALQIMDEGSCDERYGVKVSKPVYRALKACWTNHPERIVKSLSNKNQYALCHFVSRNNNPSLNEYPQAVKSDDTEETKRENIFVYETFGNHQTCIRPADWGWLVAPLLKAIEMSPDLMLPMLAVLLTRPTDREGQNFSFFEKVAQTWFGLRLDELAEWFVKTEADWPQADVAARFQTVKMWAKKRLAQK